VNGPETFIYSSIGGGKKKIGRRPVHHKKMEPKLRGGEHIVLCLSQVKKLGLSISRGGPGKARPCKEVQKKNRHDGKKCLSKRESREAGERRKGSGRHSVKKLGRGGRKNEEEQMVPGCSRGGLKHCWLRDSNGKRRKE